MTHQDTPTGIHFEHPPVQPNKAILNAYKSEQSHLSLGMLLDGLIDELPHLGELAAQMRIVEKLRFALVISGYSKEWKAERVLYMMSGVREMQTTFLSANATVSPSPEYPGQAVINTINHHLSTLGEI